MTDIGQVTDLKSPQVRAYPRESHGLPATQSAPTRNVEPHPSSRTRYAFLAGRIGGKAFEDQPLVGFAVAFGGALVISELVEVIRRLVDWRNKKRSAKNSSSTRSAAR